MTRSRNEVLPSASSRVLFSTTFPLETPRGDFLGEGRWVPRAAATRAGWRSARALSSRVSSSYGLIDAKSKPKSVLVLVSLRVTRGRGLPLGDKVFFLLQSEATFYTLSAPPTDSQR